MSGGNNSTYLSKPASCKFCEIFKNTSFHGTPLVADHESNDRKTGLLFKIPQQILSCKTKTLMNN